MTVPSRSVLIARPLRSIREDLGDELVKSGFTAEDCEMAHQYLSR
jgi:hypothetical protein